jgi:hypothetical protein
MDKFRRLGGFAFTLFFIVLIGLFTWMQRPQICRVSYWRCSAIACVRNVLGSGYDQGDRRDSSPAHDLAVRVDG